MAKRKTARRVRTARKTRTIVISAPRRRARRAARSFVRRARRRGAAMLAGGNTKTMLINGAAAVGGALGGNFLAGLLPIADARLRAIVPIGAGVLLGGLPMTRKIRGMGGLAIGMIAAGGLMLISGFTSGANPQKAIAGEWGPEERAILGEPQNFTNLPEQLEVSPEMMGYPESMTPHNVLDESEIHLTPA